MIVLRTLNAWAKNIRGRATIQVGVYLLGTRRVAGFDHFISIKLEKKKTQSKQLLNSSRLTKLTGQLTKHVDDFLCLESINFFKLYKTKTISLIILHGFDLYRNILFYSNLFFATSVILLLQTNEMEKVFWNSGFVVTYIIITFIYIFFQLNFN